MTTPNLALTELANGQQNFLNANTTFAIIDALLQTPVISKTLAAAPGSPVNGALYIMASAWAGITGAAAGRLALYRTGGGWIVIAPKEGWKKEVLADGLTYRYNGTTWLEWDATNGEVIELKQFQDDVQDSSDPTKGAAIVGMSEALGYPADTVGAVINNGQLNLNNGFVGLVSRASSCMILGDSITESQGATDYTTGYAFQAARSIINHRDGGFLQDSGFGWHVDINQGNAVYNGYSSTGGIVATGMLQDRRSLAAGQSVTITQRAYSTLYVVYDADASSGSVVIAKNGTTLLTEAVSGAGLKNTGAVNNTFLENDTVTITASGGTVVICGVLTLKTASNANLLYVAGKSGYAYQDYTTTTALDEIGYWLNLFRAGAEKLLIANLGTNNLYNNGRKKTPTALVAEMQALVVGVDARCSGVRYIFAIPPRADESIWPIKADGYSYGDYVRAILSFARSNGHGVVRHDLSALSRDTTCYVDGLHPGDRGHRIMAQSILSVIGAPFNPAVRTVRPAAAQRADYQSAIQMNDLWTGYAADGSTNGVAHTTDNMLCMSGLLKPNGSVSTTVGTLPVGYRPVGRTAYVVLNSSDGPISANIPPNGQIRLASIPGAWLSLEGVFIAINRS